MVVNILAFLSRSKITANTKIAIRIAVRMWLTFLKARK
jgi:hypothetical protein